MKNFLRIILCAMLVIVCGRGQTAPTATNSEAVTAIALSAGKLLAEAGRDGAIRIYDINRGEVTGRHDLAKSGVPMAAMGFCESNLLVSVARDGTVKTWDAVANKLLRSIRLSFGKKPMAVIAPGREPLLAEAEAGKVRLWNYEMGRRLRGFEVNDSDAAAVAFTPDGKRLVIGSVKGVVRVIDVTAWRVARMIDLDAPIYSIAASEKRIAVGYGDGSVAILNLAGDQDSVPEVSQPPGPIIAVAFSPGGEKFASGNADGSVKIWDGGTLKLLNSLQGKGGAVRSIVFSPNGKGVASCDADGFADYWTLPARRNDDHQ